MLTKIRLVLLAVLLVMVGTLASATVEAAPAASSNPCVLPRLTGTPLAVVRQLLPLLGCRLGTIARQPSISINKDAVIATRPAAGRYQQNRVVDLVASGGTASGEPSSTTSGRGTNDDPYTGSCKEVDGDCRVTFSSRRLLGIFDSEYVPAYRCPAGDPWLLKKTVTQGRIVPPGVLIEAAADVGVNITGVSKREGKTEKRGHKVYAFDYATGTLTGFPHSSVTNWGFGVNDYRVSIYCTGDLKKANLADVRG